MVKLSLVNFLEGWTRLLIARTETLADTLGYTPYPRLVSAMSAPAASATLGKVGNYR